MKKKRTKQNWKDGKNNKLKNNIIFPLIPLILFIFLTTSIIYLIVINPTQWKQTKNVKYNFVDENSQNNLKNYSDCVEGKILNCTNDKNCEGIKICNNGEYGNCIISKKCNPENKEECWIGCKKGYKYCNSCGTDYSDCKVISQSINN